MGESNRGTHDGKTGVEVGCHDRRIGRIDWNVHLAANALDDARVNLPVEGLRAAAIIGMGVNDSGAGARAGDAFRDDGLDRIGNAALQRAALGTVQRRLNPDLAHRAGSLF